MIPLCKLHVAAVKEKGWKKAGYILRSQEQSQQKKGSMNPLVLKQRCLRVSENVQSYNRFV